MRTGPCARPMAGSTSRSAPARHANRSAPRGLARTTTASPSGASSTMYSSARRTGSAPATTFSSRSLRSASSATPRWANSGILRYATLACEAVDRGGDIAWGTKRCRILSCHCAVETTQTPSTSIRTPFQGAAHGHHPAQSEENLQQAVTPDAAIAAAIRGPGSPANLTLPLVRQPGRGSREVLRLDLQDGKDRHHQPVSRRRPGNPPPPAGIRDDRGFRHQRIALHRTQRRPDLQVQRGGLAPGALQDAEGDRLLLGKAGRWRRPERAPVRVAEGQVRAVMAGR